MEFLFLLLLILVNGLFAMSEMAVVSSRKTRLQQWADEGKSGAGVALELAAEPGHFLSAVQVGITLIGILSGAFGEATIATGISDRIAQVPSLAPHAETIALAVVVLGITFLSLILGELAPKRFALRNPEGIAVMTPRPMRLAGLKVGAIMTPRADVVYLDVEGSSDDIQRKILDSSHSVMPVCRGGIITLLRNR